jgi:hypothetical protein
MIGLEIDPAVAATTSRRYRRYPNVEIRAGDAIASLPREGTIFYLGNPFNREATQRFSQALIATRGDCGATIGFFNLNHEDLFNIPPWDLRVLPSPGIYGLLAVIRLRARASLLDSDDPSP